MVGLIILALVALASPLVAWHYLGRLPEAPSCPQCTALTLERRDAAVWAAISQLSPTSLRECTHCGWRGRMRWRWAHSHADD